MNPYLPLSLFTAKIIMIMVGDNAYFQVCLHMYVIRAALYTILAMAIFRSFSITARVL